MSEQQLPVSPVTGRPSSITAMVRQSVGIGQEQDPSQKVIYSKDGRPHVWRKLKGHKNRWRLVPREEAQPVQQARHKPVPLYGPAGLATRSRGYSPREVARASVGLPPAGQPAPAQASKADVAASVAQAVQAAVAPVVQQLSRVVDHAMQQSSAAARRQQQPTGPHVMRSVLGGTVVRDPTIHGEQPAQRSANPTHGVMGGGLVRVTSYAGQRNDAQAFRAQAAAWLNSGLQPGQVLSPCPPLKAAKGQRGITAAQAARLQPYGPPM